MRTLRIDATMSAKVVSIRIIPHYSSTKLPRAAIVSDVPLPTPWTAGQVFPTNSTVLTIASSPIVAPFLAEMHWELMRRGSLEAAHVGGSKDESLTLSSAVGRRVVVLLRRGVPEYGGKGRGWWSGGAKGPTSLPCRSATIAP